jgi:hypothetical protein
MRKKYPTQTLVFSYGGRTARYKVPHAARLVRVQMSKIKGQTEHTAEAMKTTLLYAIKGLHNAYPEIAPERIKKWRMQINEIFKNTTTEGRSETEIKREIFSKLETLLSGKEGMTQEQIGF